MLALLALALFEAEAAATANEEAAFADGDKLLDEEDDGEDEST